MAQKYLLNYPIHAKENNQLNLLIDISRYIAAEYERKGDYQMANQVLESLWEGIEDKGNIKKYTLIINELGIIKESIGEIEKAREFYNLVIFGEDVHESDVSIAYHNLAETYLIHRMFDEAEGYYLKAIELKRALNDDESEFISRQDLGEIYFFKKEYKRAIKQWNVGLGLVSDLGDLKVFETYEWLAKAYEMLGESELTNTYDLLSKAKRNEYESSAEWIKAEQERQDFREFLADLEKKRAINETSHDYVVLIVVSILLTITLTIGLLGMKRNAKKKKLYQELGDILLEDDSIL